MFQITSMIYSVLQTIEQKMLQEHWNKSELWHEIQYC